VKKKERPSSPKGDSPLSGRSLHEQRPFVDRFGLSPADLREVLGLALSTGGDFAEIYMERRAFDFVNMEEDIIKETAESVGLGLGIRVLSGDKTGFGYTNDLALDRVRNAALTAAAIASGRAKARPAGLRE
jgi:TldD protein